MRDSEPLQGKVAGRLIRGGTSKGFFVRGSALPDIDDDLLDSLILELFGSPDPLQVDGMGGSHSHTSKIMIVAPSTHDEIDIEYTFGQVGVEKPVVDWSGNCGNLTSAIGVFGIEEGIIEPEDSPVVATLYNTNTDTTIEQTIPVVENKPNPYGDYEIDGVPGSGRRIDSKFLNPDGGVLGSLFPTGNASDTITVDGESFDVSVADVANPCVFVHAEDLDVQGDELPESISESPELLERLELIRGAVCEQLDLVGDKTDARTEQPTVPFIAFVSSPQDYKCSVNKSISAEDIDITARIMTSQSPHHAYAMTGAMCLAATSKLDGTIPNEALQSDDGEVRIGHPKGRIPVEVDVDDSTIHSVTVSRTAREIMRGTAFYRYVDRLGDVRES